MVNDTIGCSLALSTPPPLHSASLTRSSRAWPTNCARRVVVKVVEAVVEAVVVLVVLVAVSLCSLALFDGVCGVAGAAADVDASRDDATGGAGESSERPTTNACSVCQALHSNGARSRLPAMH
jgi:hypothetical protein